MGGGVRCGIGRRCRCCGVGVVVVVEGVVVGTVVMVVIEVVAGVVVVCGAVVVVVGAAAVPKPAEPCPDRAGLIGGAGFVVVAVVGCFVAVAEIDVVLIVDGGSSVGALWFLERGERGGREGGRLRREQLGLPGEIVDLREGWRGSRGGRLRLP